MELGPFTLIVGANASGKSNIRDAFRLLHGIGRGYALADIVGGKYGAGGQVEWERIRGAAGEIVQFGCQSLALSVDLSLREPGDEFPIESASVRIGNEVESSESQRNASMWEAQPSTPLIPPIRTRYAPKTTTPIFYCAWPSPATRENTAIGSRFARISQH